MSLKHLIGKHVVIQTRDGRIHTGKLVSENDFIVLELVSKRMAISKKI